MDNNQKNNQKKLMLNRIEALIHNLTDLEVELQNKSIFMLPMLMHLTETGCKDMIEEIKNYTIINK